MRTEQGWALLSSSKQQRNAAAASLPASSDTHLQCGSHAWQQVLQLQLPVAVQAQVPQAGQAMQYCCKHGHKARGRSEV